MISQGRQRRRRNLLLVATATFAVFTSLLSMQNGDGFTVLLVGVVAAEQQQQQQQQEVAVEVDGSTTTCTDSGDDAAAAESCTNSGDAAAAAAPEEISWDTLLKKIFVPSRSNTDSSSSGGGSPPSPIPKDLFEGLQGPFSLFPQIKKEDAPHSDDSDDDDHADDDSGVLDSSSEEEILQDTTKTAEENTETKDNNGDGGGLPNAAEAMFRNLLRLEDFDNKVVKGDDEEASQSSNTDSWEQILMMAREHQIIQNAAGEASWDEKLKVIMSAFERVKQQFDVAFDGLDLNKFDLIQLWYALQHEERRKNAVWKRQQHRFQKPLDLDLALELGDAAYLNALAYADSCEDIEYYLQRFRNNSWVMVNCTVEAKPEQPAHYIAVRKEQVSVQESSKSWFQFGETDAPLEVAFIIRATKDIMDMLTDALLETVPWHGGLSHHGISKAALWLWDLYKDWIPALLDASKKSKMNLWTIGYSLGAGTAALLTMEFNANFPKDKISSKSLGFGTPAVLNRELSESQMDTITTFVVDADCVSRMSGATVYNMFVRASNYNWTLDALEDFDQVVPFLRETVPLADAFLTDDAIAKMREDLTRTLVTKFEKKLHKSIPVDLGASVHDNATGVNEYFQTVELIAPGKCIHLYRQGPGWQGSFLPCHKFNEIEIVSHMVDDHLVNKNIYVGLLSYIRQLKDDWNWMFEYDLKEFPFMEK